MRIKENDTGRVIYFVAVDSVDLYTRLTSLTGVSVYYSVDGGTTASMTTPTITAVDAANMPGVFKLAIDESGMVALPSGVNESEMALHITASPMAPVTRVIEVYRETVASRMLVNKAVQDKLTGKIDYYDDDGQTKILTHTPTDAEATITRTPS